MRSVKVAMDSPYVNRLMAVSDLFTNSELALAMDLFSMQRNPCDLVFEVKNVGWTVHRVTLESLCPNLYVEAGVIDTWSFILNLERKYRDPASRTRFFFPTSIIWSYMYDNKLKKEDKLKSFQENASSLFKVYPNDASFRKTELVFFPICRNDHFFVLVFDLKVPKLFIPDNAKLTMHFHAKYTKVCNLVQYCFGEHFKSQNHPKAKMIEDIHPSRINMPWITRDNVVDCGVFAMYYMDRFKATPETDWSEELAPKSLVQNNQLRKLRVRYATKFLTYPLNLHANQMIINANRFNILHPKEDYRNVVATAKNSRDERVEKLKESLSKIK